MAIACGFFIYLTGSVVMSCMARATPPSRKSLIAVHLFFCHSHFFREKTQKARLRRYVFLVVLHREHTCSRCMCSRCSHLNQESKMSQIGFPKCMPHIISSSHSFQSTNTKRLPKAQTPNGCRSYHIIASSLWPSKATMGLKEMVRMCGFDMP